MNTAERGRSFLDGPSRLQGIDLARALAVCGMFAAHLIALPLPVIGDPATWIGVAGGRSSILFATLAGVSLALITTIAGLVIAIPAMAVYAWFRRTAARQVAHLECACSDLLTAILTQRVK